MAKLSYTQKRKADLLFRDIFDALTKKGISRDKFLKKIKNADHIHFGETHLSMADTSTAYNLIKDAKFVPDYVYLEYMSEHPNLGLYRWFGKWQEANGKPFNIDVEKSPAMMIVNQNLRHDEMIKELSEKINVFEKVITYGGSAHVIKRYAALQKWRQTELFKPTFEELTKKSKNKLVVRLCTNTDSIPDRKPLPPLVAEAMDKLKRDFGRRSPPVLLDYLASKVENELSDKVRTDERAILQKEGYYLYVIPGDWENTWKDLHLIFTSKAWKKGLGQQ